MGVDESGPAVVQAGTRGSFRGYGVNVEVALGRQLSATTSGADATLPLPLLIAGWLAEQAPAVQVVGELLSPATPTADCLARGQRLAQELLVRDWSLVVLADGARTHAAPGAGRIDERAGTFDAAVATALATADIAALAGLDETLAAELGAQGRAAWQVLAGVARASGTPWEAELLYSGAPFGVGYHVALWQARP